jgi:hypothetical protein
LAESDLSHAEIDLRCLRMEFFYFPEYRSLTADEQRVARKKYHDVCDEIMYHLIVAKRPMGETEMRHLGETVDHYDPPRVVLRRAREQNERLQAEVEQLRESLVARQRELERSQAAHEARLAELEAARAAETEQLRESLVAGQCELERLQSAHATRITELEVARAAESERLRAALVSRESDLALVGRLAAKTSALATEVESFRARRVIRWVDRFRRGADLSEYLNPAFQQLQDDSLLFTPNVRDFALRPSENLQTVDFLAYPLGPIHRRLSGLMLAPILTVPLSPGVLGLELVVDGRVLAQSHVRLEQIDERIPTRFEFPPVVASGDELIWLRVFARDAVRAVRIFEWQRHQWLSWGAPARRAFVGFVFAPEGQS